jgi:hypothetical protein
MNRAEYYKQRRIFRAALSSIDRDHLRRMPKGEQDSVWSIFWDGVFMKMPKAIHTSLIYRKGAYDEPWPPTSRARIRCNYSHMANSYPHPTKNP